MIKVCDSIMGSGKSSAAITYMNEHPDSKFIYITPYLEEVKRIKESCPELHFAEPNAKIERYRFRKTIHTEALINEGRNIVTTHSAFKRYTKEMLGRIEEHEYILIIDENVDVLDRLEADPFDLKLSMEAGYIEEKDGSYVSTDKEYKGTALKTELFDLVKSRELIKIKGSDNDFYYWVLPSDLLYSFKDVIVLTYMFQGQSLYHFLKIHKLSYEYIGVEQDEEGTYRFGKYPGYVPEYVKDLKNKIHILDNYRMNQIGKDRFALSISWFDKNDDGVKQLKNNISNCFNNIWRNESSANRLWGTYKSTFNKVKGKGYTKSHLNFNIKATNKYKNKNCLVYAVNIFMNVNEKLFYQRYGIEVNEDLYALSIMIQWIWRSAIRDGQDIYIYIPSKRMRTLLTDWIEITSKGGRYDG